MADNRRDLYEVLGLKAEASDDEIKKAYRTLAKKYHPDLNPGNQEAERKMKEVNAAYEVLSDKQMKQRYDQFGHAGIDPSYNAGGGGGFGGFGGMEDFDLGDIFGSIFGGMGGFSSSAAKKTGPQRGEHIRSNITITFEEAAFGCEKNVTVNRYENCGDCKGTGAKPGTSTETCSVCKGIGQVKTTQRTAFGVFATNAPCQACSGTGKIIKEPCETCKGSGKTRRNRTIKVKVPSGIDNGQTIKLRGEGNGGTLGGPAGDLYVAVRIREHKLFRREGQDVVLEMPISFVQATLGASVTVPTIDGNVQYDLPEGTQTGTVFRLKNSGIPNISGRGRGDQYVRVNVEIPKGLSQEQKNILKNFEESVGDQHYTEKKSFFAKVKEKFTK